jgi:peptidoglycan/LPS O-acetylase OafA/YrhL
MVFIRYNQTQSRNYSWLLGVIIVLMVLALKYNREFNFHNGLLGVFFVPFILALSMNKSRLNDWLSKPVLVYLGDISYSLYIYQYPVFYYFMDFIN